MLHPRPIARLLVYGVQAAIRVGGSEARRGGSMAALTASSRAIGLYGHIGLSANGQAA